MASRREGISKDSNLHLLRRTPVSSKNQPLEPILRLPLQHVRRNDPSFLTHFDIGGTKSSAQGDVLALDSGQWRRHRELKTCISCGCRAIVSSKREWYILRHLELFLRLAREYRSSAQQHRDTASSWPPTTAQFLNSLADITDGFADQLQAAVSAWENQTLTIKEAAQESGYSPETLRRAIRNGGLPNAGCMNSPRIWRVDLPKKLNGASNA